jgi:hypothetical protein
MASNPESRPHLISKAQGVPARRTKPSGGGATGVPRRPDPIGHASSMRAAFRHSIDELQSLYDAQEVERTDDGVVIQLRLVVDAIEQIDKLGLESNGCVLLRAAQVGGQVIVLIFVPKDRYAEFERRFEKYLTGKPTKKGERPLRRFVDALDEIALATLASYWSAATDMLPNDNRAHWWEVWILPDAWERFRTSAARYGLSIGDGEPLRFAERYVCFANGTPQSVYRTILGSSAVAELRPKYGLAGYVEGFSRKDQAGAAQDLAGRRVRETEDMTYVAVLDQGVHAGHPLLDGVIDPADVLTVVGGTGTTSKVHGDGMAGLAVFGPNLDAYVASAAPITVHALLESVRIDGGKDGVPYGETTRQAVAFVDSIHPERRRLHCLASTEEAVGPFPSSWSAALDRICAGDPASEIKKRELIFVSGGNLDEPILRTGYAGRNAQSSCQSPAQSWNAISVGAMTRFADLIPDGTKGLEPLALPGDIAPMSTTSVTWDEERRAWPIKPDIVMEGGNYATVPGSDDAVRYGKQGELVPLSLQLHANKGKLFQEFGHTSGATALAANLGARVWNANSALWPETVRGLIIHSARHTPAMLARQGEGGAKTAMRPVFRMFGYGEPSVEAAIASATNRAVVVHQADLQPFRSEKSDARIKELKFFDVPLPAAALSSEFADVSFTLRVTLSYYIEPNPGGRTYRGKYGYPSHRLAFAIQRPGESEPVFNARMQALAADPDDVLADKGDAAEDEGWKVGSQVRNVSTVQSDWIFGTGEALVSRRKLAVYPMSGWWKNRPKLGFADARARFSLIVSLETDQDIDIYTPIEALIKTPIPV